LSRGSWFKSGWQGASLVAITYVYFLIFAQFAFLKRLASLGVAGTHLTAVMAAMASGGILLSLLTPRVKLFPSPNLRLRAGLWASASAAFLSLLPLGLAASIAASFMIGAALGLLTVTLVTHLRQWTGNRHPLLLVGLGTGTGYLISNLPPLFTASVEWQATTAGLLCLAGIGVTLAPTYITLEELRTPSRPSPSFLRVLACFAALVWLDSAAFFIIQKTPILKAGTWEGSLHLYINGLLHLGAAMTVVWLLRRRGLSMVFCTSFLALGIACLFLPDSRRMLFASIFYPIGVSLYSVALVAYPSLLGSAASAAERGRQAGWLYAIAGWVGSAMGIGMGQNLGHIPLAFVLSSGAVIFFLLLPWPLKFFVRRKREITLTAAILLTAFGLNRIPVAADPSFQLTQVDRGRQVYISEGCINCHSQYVRPNTVDELMWGPVKSLEQLRRERPPLIGNRRQGPDLSEVGGRRSALWLKTHFYNPPEVSGASIMPSYAFLFHDERGDNLVSYLESLHESSTSQHLITETNWHPAASAVATANSGEGERAFKHYCATCHDAGGSTRGEAHFKRFPPDLAVGPYLHLPSSENDAQRRDRLAHIIKFGIPGTDMPGHEYWPDDEISSIAYWLSHAMGQLSQNP
jgi:cytochrome c oxidase cbb3-type subunit 2